MGLDFLIILVKLHMCLNEVFSWREFEIIFYLQNWGYKISPLKKCHFRYTAKRNWQGFADGMEMTHFKVFISFSGTVKSGNLQSNRRSGSLSCEIFSKVFFGINWLMQRRCSDITLAIPSIDFSVIWS